LCSLAATMARWHWTRLRDESLVSRRACESEQLRLLQPAYAAMFSHESRFTQSAQPDNNDWTVRCLDKSW
jgi:hypothetical protein